MEANIAIQKNDLFDGQIPDLLNQHHQQMLKHSPADSVHALTANDLRQPELTFWSAHYQGEFAACGALKELDKKHGELKSMKTVDKHCRKGIAQCLLQEIIAEAKKRAYQRVSLETGTMDAFIPARTLYTRFGFVKCPPFADYKKDPHSVFMTLEITND